MQGDSLITPIAVVGGSVRRPSHQIAHHVLLPLVESTEYGPVDVFCDSGLACKCRKEKKGGIMLYFKIFVPPLGLALILIPFYFALKTPNAPNPFTNNLFQICLLVALLLMAFSVVIAIKDHKDFNNLSKIAETSDKKLSQSEKKIDELKSVLVASFSQLQGEMKNINSGTDLEKLREEKIKALKRFRSYVKAVLETYGLEIDLPKIHENMVLPIWAWDSKTGNLDTVQQNSRGDFFHTDTVKPEDVKKADYLRKEALAAHNQGEFERAALLIDKIETIKANPQLCFQGAIIYDAAKRYDDGLNLISRSLEFEPNNPYGNMVAGQLYFHMGGAENYGLALIHYSVALEFSPPNDNNMRSQIYFNLGSIYDGLGIPKKACKCFEKSLELNPSEDKYARIAKEKIAECK